jgi:tRNA (guanine-N7-)-methyltransferase
MPLIYENPFLDPQTYLQPGKNPYLSKLTQSGAEGLPIVVGSALKGRRGKWREDFPQTDRPLVLEIGCHYGRTLVDMATKDSHLNLLGMDITFKRVYKTATKAKRREFGQIKVILASAHFLDELFEDGELSGILCFFPDPWNKKKRQMKNRLLSRKTCEIITRKLALGGFFWLKTDDKTYYEDVGLAMTGLCERTELEYPGLNTQNYSSSFETLFEQREVPTYAGVWTKP